MRGGITFSDDLKEQVRVRLKGLIDSGEMNRDDVAAAIDRDRDTIDNLLNERRPTSSAVVLDLLKRVPQIGSDLFNEALRELIE